LGGSLQCVEGKNRKMEKSKRFPEAYGKEKKNACRRAQKIEPKGRKSVKGRTTTGVSNNLSNLLKKKKGCCPNKCENYSLIEAERRRKRRSRFSSQERIGEKCVLEKGSDPAIVGGEMGGSEEAQKRKLESYQDRVAGAELDGSKRKKRGWWREIL